ncbi:MAG: hypothetical protein QW098_02000 [Candidatus Hadarchaeales archaeon]
MPKCSCCGRELKEKDKEKIWRECRYCGLPVCFNCTHYLGTTVRDLFGDHVEVVCVCGVCKPKK